MILALQIVLLLIIIFGFLGMIGENDKDLRRHLSAVTVAAIIAEVIIIYIQG